MSKVISAKKNETVIAVMEAFDEVERKRHENQFLKDTIDRMRAKGGGSEERGEPRWAGNIYEYGRRAIWEKYGDNYYSKKVVVTEDDDGNRTPEEFGGWARRSFDRFPDFMSREDFVEEYEAEMRMMYAEELDKAMGEPK